MADIADHDSYKYQWARWVAQENLNKHFQSLNAKLSSSQDLPPADTVLELAKRQPEGLTGAPPVKPGEFRVGIVGAGCAGLFTGMILDYLGSKVDGINISYDILEAAGKERLGGRLFTHKFSDAPNDYYDVGAMRFPHTPIMKRTFCLFRLLGLEFDKDLIKYYYDDVLNVCPSRYNDETIIGKPTGIDPYKINKELPPDDNIPESLRKDGPDETVQKVLKPLIDEVKSMVDFKDWEKLMKVDFMSMRQFLQQEKPTGPGCNFNTIEWLETFTDSTGAFDQALTETVFDQLDFGSTTPPTKWYCIKGGTQQVATKMAKTLKHQPEFHREVSAITATADKLSLTIKHCDTKHEETRDYFAVFNSTTLGALQRMDVSKAGLSYPAKQAIRSLSYGASCKVGMKFKQAWWMQPPHNIKKGGSATTDLPLRECVYPSYNIHDPPDQPHILLCSYTWTQDAQRIGALIAGDDGGLKDLIFHDLARLHETKSEPYEKVLKKIKSLYDGHFAYDWYTDRYAVGAFALFGPGEFSQMWPEIVKPHGWLYLIGEAASAHHAWIVGALESAVRGVLQMLHTLHLQNPGYTPYREAFKLLHDGDDHLPFGPAPKEMPPLQLTTVDNMKVVDHLEGKGGDDLTFMAAQVILRFLDQLVEEIEGGQGKDGGLLRSTS